jgi:glutamate/aspartate transport system substrate-binding protein
MAFLANGIGPLQHLRLQCRPNASGTKIAKSMTEVNTLTPEIDGFWRRPPSLELRYLLRQSAFSCVLFFSCVFNFNRKFQMNKSLIALAAMLAMGAAHAEDTLKKIKDSGAVTMGVRESSGALSYTLGDGKYTGFHVEICTRALADIQKQLGLAKMETKYQPVTSGNRIPLVQNGTVDIECGSTTNNATRQKDVAFAMTTFVEEVRIAVKANSGITNIAQLAGKTVATTTGTTSVQTLRKHERATGVDLKEVFGKDHADSFLLLESGRADAFVMDGAILAGNIAKAKNPADFKIVGEVLSVEPIAIMMRKDDPAFKKAVDDSIKAMIKSGDMAKLWDKWFLQPIPPTNTKVGLAVSESTKTAWANPNDKPMEDYAKK